MYYSVMPIQKFSEISYRAKCVAVESERVLGDFFVTQQTKNLIYCADSYHCPPIYKKRKRNLIQYYYEAPNFMELNRSSKENEKSKAIITRNRRSKSLHEISHSEPIIIRKNSETTYDILKEPKVYPSPLPRSPWKQHQTVTTLVDKLLLDIYGLSSSERGRSESDSTPSLLHPRPQHKNLQKTRLLLKSKAELQVLVINLREHITHAGGLLVRQLRRKDYLLAKCDKQCDVITAHLQAHSRKRVEDTKMRFSLTPQPGESGFIQWLDAMKMVARLPGGIPPEFRKRLWLTLAERHLEQRGVDWKQAEKICFNEWSNPDDEELGIQIVKDLHRTGCSLFCGAAGRDNQAVLRRVLLGFARWNKTVGYCQGLNVLAALILQVMDRAESSAVKVMIYLIEGVLPEGYFADNLRGLSVDMAVFRDLLRARLPKLSKHLESLQSDTKDKAKGSSYEPPLTNVFTMQWFLTLFCHCLPQEAVLRVWDLIFLEGDEVLLRTALAIWESVAERIMPVKSADEFYSIMGVLTREMLEFTDTNSLIKNIVSMGQLNNVTGLREKHRYNITPWARKLSDDEDSDTEEDERLAVAAAMFSMAQRLKKERVPSTVTALQSIAMGGDRERIALDISTLKQQYVKLRERQRQAHIILSAACARQSMVPAPTSQAMNHLLVGKSALVCAKTRPIGLPSGVIAQKPRPTNLGSARSQLRKDRQGVTLHWKDMKKMKQKEANGEKTDNVTLASTEVQSPEDSTPSLTSPKRGNGESDSDSTSTELCDDSDRLSDLDSEEQTSTSDYVMTTDNEKSPKITKSPTVNTTAQLKSDLINDCIGAYTLEAVQESSSVSGCNKVKEENLSLTEVSVAKITDQIRRLSVGNDNNANVHSDSTNKDQVNVEQHDYSLNEPSVIEAPPEMENSYKYDDSLGDLTSGKYDYLDSTVDKRDDSKSSDVQEISYQKNSLLTDYVKSETIVPEETNDDLSHENSLKSELNTCSNYDTNLIDESEKKLEISKMKMNETEQLDSVTIADDNQVLSPLQSEDNICSSPSYLTPKEENRLKTNYNKSYVVGHIPIRSIDPNKRANEIDLESYKETDTVSSLHTENKLNISLFRYDNYKLSEPAKSISNIKLSPRTPESTKSFDSGETMGPDSKPPSVTLSPRTPNRSLSNEFEVAKSPSSLSSDSKTLVLHSHDSDNTSETAKDDLKKNLFEISPSTTPFSTDSLKNKSEVSPKLIISSSSESYSPSKIKSSERSFSSDLQSPISANSIKYTSNYSKRCHDDASNSPIDLVSATSPFYPINNPNQKTPSPNNNHKQKSSVCGNSQQDFSVSNVPTKFSMNLDQSKFEDLAISGLSTRDSSYMKPQFKLDKDESLSFSSRTKIENCDKQKYEIGREMNEDKYIENEIDDQFSEKDDFGQLPSEKFDKDFSRRSFRPFGRSSSSLDKKFCELKSSTSTQEFQNNTTRKRCSDILEDMKHLEAKAMGEGSTDSSMLTEKTGSAWEEMKSLEARRQDTFSDSAKSFSRCRLDIPSINVIGEGRKSYVVKPKITIDENSDSILKRLTLSKNDEENDDGRESKVGVWTKVKPRKTSENGRRSSSDRALKIIQENSAILHKILTCQAKKRLPDLEEISKEITISPINEEISKIFSPILEKMGLNEEEINEELARINFKDFDEMSTTNVSEFDAKINDELSKLSLIDDNEVLDHYAVDEMIANEYLDAREALLDRKINEELSKLLSNYDDGASSASIEHGLMSQNISRMGLHMSDLSKNLFAYKSPNESIETRSNITTVPEPIIQMKSIQDYETNINYPPSKYDYALPHENDVNIHSELNMLNELSTTPTIPKNIPEILTERVSPITYNTQTSPYLKLDTSPKRHSIPQTSPFSRLDSSPKRQYSPQKTAYDTSPIKSSYDVYKPYDFKTRISPIKCTIANCSVLPYNDLEMTNSSSYIQNRTTTSTSPYDSNASKSIMSKETLEFRVKYDEESTTSIGNDYLSYSKGKMLDLEMDKGLPYYESDTNKQMTPTNYITNEFIATSPSTLLKSENFQRKYSLASPKEYSHTGIADLRLTSLSPIEQNTSRYLPLSNQKYQTSSPTSKFDDVHLGSSFNHYSTIRSPVSMDDTDTTLSHNIYPECSSKYDDVSIRGSSCYKKSTMNLGPMTDTHIDGSYDQSPNRKAQYSPFPSRNATRKPKELGLKLGLYSPKDSEVGPLKKS